jgi:hypothetical protein
MRYKNHLVVISLFLVSIYLFPFYELGYDLYALLGGAKRILECIDQSPVLMPCGAGVVHFPLFQYLLVLPLLSIGFQDDFILKSIVVFNFISYLLFLFFWTSFVERKLKVAESLPTSILLLMTTIPVYYATSSFNEIISFSLFALLTILSIENRIRSVIFLSLIISITKEIAFPFIFYCVLVGRLVGWTSEQKINLNLKKILSNNKKYLFIIVPVFGGVLINFYFNYFRYGSIYYEGNKSYFDLAYSTDTPYVWSYFFAIFFSPSLGLVVFNFFFCFIFIFMLPLMHEMSIDKKIAYCSSFLVLLITAFGLSKWPMPFGEISWGPRLMIPSLGISFVLLTYCIDTMWMTKYKKIIAISVIFSAFLSSLIVFSGKTNHRSEIFHSIFSATVVSELDGTKPFTIQNVDSKLFYSHMMEIHWRNSFQPILYKVLDQNWLRFSIWFLVLAIAFVYLKSNLRAAIQNDVNLKGWK